MIISLPAGGIWREGAQQSLYSGLHRCFGCW